MPSSHPAAATAPAAATTTTGRLASPVKLPCRWAFAAIAVFGLFIGSVASADTGMLRIATKPGDAQLFINGQRKGNSPAEEGQNFAIKLRNGDYTVEAVKPQGPTELYGKKTVFVADDTLQTITIEMAERPSASFRTELKQKLDRKSTRLNSSHG